jgi:predicted hotdog family 3-hydroxylacyl-ACP dehydratase
MSGRPAIIRQREAKQIISAATKVGAKKVEFLVGAVPVIVHLGVAADVELPSDSNNSFDKIMRGK